MKIVFASTPDQEEKIRELVNSFYSNIFPLYFSDNEIDSFRRLKVLHTTSRHFEYFGTLKEAYHVITSLQTIISILETKPSHKYQHIFCKNVTTLKEYGLFFPFDFSQFIEENNFERNVFSVYTKAANELLV
ncbi:YhcU family protein [Bacillus sp. 31A1R]|uniref:YhcU family protein n=1 Tax=Robertmurraya mangrovi TaxID=3098077 RepID=A0ABU5J3K6_9BACI|nr:YhcU family protein [Bacillus sp. 31A1R]MDZ5473951.1 YhcU family protein [Bacillus sp. 31A1R]